MKPKMTKYAGTNFKSLLEARWATFFDHLDLKWKYEPKQYRLGYYPEHLQVKDARIRDRSYDQTQDYYWLDNELTYTPDFILPDLDLIVEVKPSGLTRTEEIKAGRLAYRTMRDFLVLIRLEKFICVRWFDLDYPQEIDLTGLADLLERDFDAVNEVLSKAREFGREKNFEEFQGEDL